MDGQTDRDWALAWSRAGGLDEPIRTRAGERHAHALLVYATEIKAERLAQACRAYLGRPNQQQLQAQRKAAKQAGAEDSGAASPTKKPKKPKKRASSRENERVAKGTWKRRTRLNHAMTWWLHRDDRAGDYKPAEVLAHVAALREALNAGEIEWSKADVEELVQRARWAKRMRTRVPPPSGTRRQQDRGFGVSVHVREVSGGLPTLGKRR